MTAPRTYGWRKEAPSEHDWLAGIRFAAAPPPPESSSLRDRCAPPGSIIIQDKNDCVAHTLSEGACVCLTPPGGPRAPQPSRDWGYSMSGVSTGDQAHDNGRFIRDACAAYANLGWPDEAVWPYGKWPAHPGGEAHRAAFDRRAGVGVAYHRITDATGAQRRAEISQAIAHGYPVAFGTMVTAAFEDQDGKTPLHVPGMNEPYLGGHAILAVEYDAHAVRGPNWWGPDFGDHGWWCLSWDWMTSGIVSDAWALEIKPGAVS